MEQPQGFVTPGSETKVCRLLNVIYGLKQASRAWNLQFHGVLTALGFKQTFADAGIYVLPQQEGDDSSPLCVIVYVDDITIMGANMEKIKRLKSNLSARYKMTDLGEIQSYLGMRIVCDRSLRHIEIDQSGYVKDVLERFGMSDATPHNTRLPASAEEHLYKYTEQVSASDIMHYQSLIGSLLYVQIGTRPDISFAVSHLAQYAANPSPQHLQLAQYVLSYLVGTVNKKLIYDGANRDGLHGYTVKISPHVSQKQLRFGNDVGKHEVIKFAQRYHQQLEDECASVGRITVCAMSPPRLADIGILLQEAEEATRD